MLHHVLDATAWTIRAKKKSVNLYCGKHYEEAVVKRDLRSGHIWYFDDPTFILDVFHTISGRLDRAAIPTREPTDRGNLALRIPV